MSKRERRDKKTIRAKKKSVKHGIGKREQIQGISKTWKKLLESKVKWKK